MTWEELIREHLAWQDEWSLPLVVSGGRGPAMTLVIMKAKSVSLEFKKLDPEMSRESSSG